LRHEEKVSKKRAAIEVEKK
jgi:hypothetical protein